MEDTKIASGLLIAKSLIRFLVRHKFIAIILLTGLVMLLFFASSGKGDKVSYLTEKVVRGDIKKTVNAAGEVAAVRLVSVGAQVSGQIESLKVHLGQKVKKGELLAEIDSTTQRNELEISKAKLKTYEAQLVSKEVALKIAQSQYDREVKLKSRDAASEESLENAENTLALAKAAVAELQSLIAQTQISLDTAETNLAYTRIMAPQDGTVVSIPVEEGQTVNANQTTPTIVQIADLSEMEIKMQISEGDVTKVRPGMAVAYSILSEPDMQFKGELQSLDPGLTTLTEGSYKGSIDSGTAVYYYGKLVVPNKEGVLRIGMTTQNIITVAEVKNVLLVPTLSVEKHGPKSVVRVLKNGKAQEREVKTGLSDNLKTQIVEGLSEGEEVVSAQMTEDEVARSANVNLRRRY